MTNEEAKQQAIKNAYGEYWDEVKNQVDENGFIEIFKLPPILFDTVMNEGSSKWRPKSLQGIDNNNGWIRIESDNDLPKDDIDCHFIVGKLCYNGLWDNQLKYFYCGRNKIIGVTYYKIIEIPKPPIY